MSSNNPHEQILQLLITGGFLDPGKLKEARDIIGKCAPSGSLEDAAEEYLNEKPDWAGDQNNFHTTRSIYLGDMKAAFLAGAAYGKGTPIKFDDEEAKAFIKTDPDRYHAICLLKIRDNMAKQDYSEAYHWLYAIASPHFDKYEPWEELEKIAAGTASRPSIDIVDELRKANPYEVGGLMNWGGVWGRCCDKLQELLNQSK